jgi:hypothetical protein
MFDLQKPAPDPSASGTPIWHVMFDRMVKKLLLLKKYIIIINFHKEKIYISYNLYFLHAARTSFRERRQKSTKKHKDVCH